MMYMYFYIVSNFIFINDIDFVVDTDGYSVKDITYKWKDGMKNSVSISQHVQLPQFKVRGHKEKEKIEVLSTGRVYLHDSLVQVVSRLGLNIARSLHYNAYLAQCTLGNYNTKRRKQIISCKQL